MTIVMFDIRPKFNCLIYVCKVLALELKFQTIIFPKYTCLYAFIGINQPIKFEIMSNNQNKQDLIKKANRLLRKAGYSWIGTELASKLRGQAVFEKRIIMTPMGNKR